MCFIRVLRRSGLGTKDASGIASWQSQVGQSSHECGALRRSAVTQRDALQCSSAVSVVPSHGTCYQAQVLRLHTSLTPANVSLIVPH